MLGGSSSSADVPRLSRASSSNVSQSSGNNDENTQTILAAIESLKEGQASLATLVRQLSEQTTLTNRMDQLEDHIGQLTEQTTLHTAILARIERNQSPPTQLVYRLEAASLPAAVSREDVSVLYECLLVHCKHFSTLLFFNKPSSSRAIRLFLCSFGQSRERAVHSLLGSTGQSQECCPVASKTPLTRATSSFDNDVEMEEKEFTKSPGRSEIGKQPVVGNEMTADPSSTSAPQKRFGFVGSGLNAHLLRANTIAYPEEHSPPEVVCPVPMRGRFWSGADDGLGGESAGSDGLEQQLQHQEQKQQQIEEHRADTVSFRRTQSCPAPLLEEDYIQPVFWGQKFSKSLPGGITKITNPTANIRYIHRVMVEFFTEFNLRLAQHPITAPALTRADVYSDLPGYCMRHHILLSQRTLLPDPTAAPCATRHDLEQHSHWFVQGCSIHEDMRFEFPLGPRFCKVSVPREDTVQYGGDSRGKVYVIEVIVFAGEYNGWGRVGRTNQVDELRELGCLVNELPDGAERRYWIRVDGQRPKENAWCEYALLQERWLWQRDLDAERGVLERREGVYPAGGSVQLENALNAGRNTPFLTSTDEPVHRFDEYNHFAIHLHHNSEMCRQHAASSSTPTTPCTAESYNFHVDLSITNSTVTNLNSTTLPGLTRPSTAQLQQQFTDGPHYFLTCKRVDEVGIEVGGGVPRDEGGGQVIFQTPLGPRFCEFGPPRDKNPLERHKILAVGFEMQIFLDAVAAVGVAGGGGAGCGRFYFETRLEEGTRHAARYAPLNAYLREAWEWQRRVDEERRVADVFAVRGDGGGREEVAEEGEDDIEGKFFEEDGPETPPPPSSDWTEDEREDVEVVVHAKRKEIHSPDGQDIVSKRLRFGEGDTYEEEEEEFEGDDNCLGEDSACMDDDSDVEEDADVSFVDATHHASANASLISDDDPHCDSEKPTPPKPIQSRQAALLKHATTIEWPGSQQTVVDEMENEVGGMEVGDPDIDLEMDEKKQRSGSVRREFATKLSMNDELTKDCEQTPEVKSSHVRPRGHRGGAARRFVNNNDTSNDDKENV
ncbi:hypothetical protein HDU98_002599 [Podochytrium sp. JEL0797]|nr:hypothetical protein HDU98_002599 [Podochytrium sp. JEL0797]